MTDTITYCSINPICHVGMYCQIIFTLIACQLSLNYLHPLFRLDLLNIYDATCIISGPFNVVNVADEEMPHIHISGGIGQCQAR
jgi:hypothetical protein